MKVFTDFHHEELHESLCILFEDRLKWELYKQIGKEWYHKGYWKNCKHKSSIEQYLGFSSQPFFRYLGKRERLVGDTLRLKKNNLRYTNYDCKELSPGIFETSNSVYDRRYKAITFKAFCDNKFDILICTLPENIPVLLELKKKFQPTAKLIFQVGNNWNIPNEIPNILTSSKISTSKKHNILFYHQEFDISLFNNKQNPSNYNSVASMMHYPQKIDDFISLEKQMTNWEYKMYGCGTRDKARGPSIKDIASVFTAESAFIYHVKKEGDGYGYNIHHAAASGRPLIVRSSYFKGMTAEPLLIDQVTCIDLDKYSLEKSIELLNQMSKNYELHSNFIYDKFNTLVNFDEEFLQIKSFLENLK